MCSKTKNLIFIFLSLSFLLNNQTIAFDPSDVVFHDSIHIGKIFRWEFTKYKANDVHYPDLSIEYKKGDIITAEVISEPFFSSSSSSLIPQPLKEDGWIKYSINETIIDITTGVFTTMGVYPYSFIYPLSYNDSGDNLVDYFIEFFDYFDENFVSKSTRENEYWQKYGEDYYENKYIRRDDDGKGYVYLKINLSTGFLSKVEVERHASDNEYDVHYILESVEYREMNSNLLIIGFSLLLITPIAYMFRKKKLSSK
jgi:hypothetical protein